MREHGMMRTITTTLALAVLSGCIPNPADYPYSSQNPSLDMSARDMPASPRDLSGALPAQDMRPVALDMRTPPEDMRPGPGPGEDMRPPPADMRPLDGRCIVGSECKCSENQACEYQQDGDPDCKKKSCDVICPGDNNTCKPKEVGDGGIITCRGQGATCEPSCHGSCDVVCEAGVGTCAVDCKKNAQCTLQCDNSGGTCKFAKCDKDRVTDCGGGRFVCDRPC